MYAFHALRCARGWRSENALCMHHSIFVHIYVAVFIIIFKVHYRPISQEESPNHLGQPEDLPRSFVFYSVIVNLLGWNALWWFLVRMIVCNTNFVTTKYLSYISILVFEQSTYWLGTKLVEIIGWVIPYEKVQKISVHSCWVFVTLSPYQKHGFKKNQIW